MVLSEVVKDRIPSPNEHEKYVIENQLKLVGYAIKSAMKRDEHYIHIGSDHHPAVLTLLEEKGYKVNADNGLKVEW